MSNDSWVKIYRRITKWHWYKNIPCKVIFLHLIVLAQYKDFSYCNIQLKKGQAIVTIRRLANETGLSVQQVRTALKKLQSTNDIFIQKSTSFSIVTLKNQEFYPDILNESLGEDTLYNAFN